MIPGEVSDADRQWLYEHCEAFLFPSLTEGFGFPVLEAMLCGKPVFMSRRTSLPEIAGDHGYFFDAYDGDALAAAYWSGMGRYHSDPGAATPAWCRRRCDAVPEAGVPRRRGSGQIFEGFRGLKARGNGLGLPVPPCYRSRRRSRRGCVPRPRDCPTQPRMAIAWPRHQEQLRCSGAR